MSNLPSLRVSHPEGNRADVGAPSGRDTQRHQNGIWRFLISLPGGESEFATHLGLQTDE